MISWEWKMCSLLASLIETVSYFAMFFHTILLLLACRGHETGLKLFFLHLHLNRGQQKGGCTFKRRESNKRITFQYVKKKKYVKILNETFEKIFREKNESWGQSYKRNWVIQMPNIVLNWITAFEVITLLVTM